MDVSAIDKKTTFALKTEIINEFNSSGRASLNLVYEGSTLLEDKTNYGVSHLMEHLVVKGIQHLGVPFYNHCIDWNAYTAEDHIVFYCTGLEEDIEQFSDDFIEGLTNFDLTEADLEKEKKIVEAEYFMDYNSVKMAHINNFHRKFLNSFGPIGEIEAIRNLTLEDCNAFYELQYKAPHQIVYSGQNQVVVDKVLENNISPDDIERKRKTFGVYDNPLHEIPKGGLENMIVVTCSLPNEYQYLIDFCSFLMDGLESPLYATIREEKGLIYNGSLQSFEHGDDLTSPIMMVDLFEENIPELIETYNNTINNIEQYFNFDRFLGLKGRIKIQDKIMKKYHPEMALFMMEDSYIELLSNLQSLDYDTVIDFVKKFYVITDDSVVSTSGLYR